ncbi:hypothetical protein C5167_046293 [Papaver somniferum]|uniref:Uncharacterized protein n=1 Tax=Papaver somniferum TaxID=3469 RepID=A0A4Y7LGW3_PAPSO|nr:hypothetical protein C5167_046293 [Papaver somniferum]
MDGIKYAVFTDKSIRLLGNNQYTSNVESGSTRTEIKHWVELFFGVKVIAMNIHRLPGKGRRMRPMGHTKEKNLKNILNNTAIHLYKNSIPSTRNGAVDSQVKSNSQNNLISGQQRNCGKGRNARGIITARHRGGGHKRLYQYDPNRNAYICLIHCGDGEKRYILHPRGSIIGDTIVSGTEVPISMGNALPLRVLIDQKEESTSTDMPLGTAIHNIEITLGKGGQLARATGAVTKLIAKEGKSATLKLPSGEVRLIFKNFSATVGQVGNVGVNQKSLGK